MVSPVLVVRCWEWLDVLGGLLLGGALAITVLYIVAACQEERPKRG